MANEIKVNKLYPGFEKEPLVEEKINSQNVFGKNLYEILGVEKTATLREIKVAYRKLSLKWHPDRPTPFGFTKDQQTEKFEEIKTAHDILMTPSEKNIYDEKFNDGKLGLEKINNSEYRRLLINTLLNKNIRNSYLPKNLQDWENKIRYQGDSATYDEINSYASRLFSINSNLFNIEEEIKKNKLDREMKVSSFTEMFADPESKEQVEEVYNKIIQEIHRIADAKGESNPDDKLKRKKIEEMKNLVNFSFLVEKGEDNIYEQQISNAHEEKGPWGDTIKSLEEIIENILKNVKNRIKFLRDEKINNNILNPKKKDCLDELHRISGWNEFLEPWEQEHLETKVNRISEDKKLLFEKCIKYAKHFIEGGYLRKYRASFWNKLEKLTDLKKEDITDGDDMRKGKKIGERYESITNKYRGIEPDPQKMIDNSQFVKMKLFLCYYKKESELNFSLFLLKLKDMGYGEDVDSGWTPSKSDDSLLKHKQNKAIEEIEKELKRYKKLSEEDKALGINWRRRFEECDNSKKINGIKEDFLDRLSEYIAFGISRPWKGGESLPPLTDPLKEKKEETIAQILEYAIENYPVITKEKLEKDNQNWENDIKKASKEEEINFIKAKVINDIKNKRAKEKEENSLDELIKEAKKEENWNNYQNLKNLLKQIKKLQSSEFYKKNELEINAIEYRTKELNPENFKNSIKSDLDEKIKNSDLSEEELSNETKKMIKEAIETGEIENKKKAEESIIQEGADKKLTNTIAFVEEEETKFFYLTGGDDDDKKEKLIIKILEVISKNDYQKKAYQKQKKKVDSLIQKLRGEENLENPETEIPWQKIIIATAAISLIIVILVSVVMKIRRVRTQKQAI